VLREKTQQKGKHEREQLMASTFLRKFRKEL
jgi:hypothetical protein